MEKMSMCIRKCMVGMGDIFNVNYSYDSMKGDEKCRQLNG